MQLTGTTNGQDQTSASYQDTTVNAGEYHNDVLSLTIQPLV